MDENGNLSVIIAEDMQPARELLSGYVNERPELRLESVAINGEETLRKLSENSYELLFLDINLPDMSGLDVLEKLDKYPHVIFTTSYDQYAIKAFEIGAVDYLLKPFSKERFNDAVDKALKIIKKKKPRVNDFNNFALSFKSGGTSHILAYEDVIFLSSSGRSSVIHTESKSYEAPDSFKVIINRLPGDLFIRIHKQYIVNLKYISKVEYLMGGQMIAYINYDQETTLPVGRTYSPVLKEKLGIKYKY